MSEGVTTVEILETQKELNLVLGDIRKEAQRRTKEAGDRIQSKLDEDKCDGLPYIKLAEARLKTIYDHWLEEHKKEIEYLEARIKVIAIPKGERRIRTIKKFTALIKEIGEQKEEGKQGKKRKLEILNKRDSISSSFEIPTENRYGVLACEEHTQESANDTDAEAKPAKITDSQKRAEIRKKKKFRDMGNEQANNRVQIEPGNVGLGARHLHSRLLEEHGDPAKAAHIHFVSIVRSRSEAFALLTVGRNEDSAKAAHVQFQIQKYWKYLEVRSSVRK
ncbi:hypothetical protein JTB14_027067 [Gonioctena quinquepunctata]|nr:hypothetical protein JTB14_027067 [Gonioctena quinquepunctata]